MCFAAPASNTEDGEATIIEGSESVAEYFIPSGYDYKFRTSNSIEKSEVADLGKNIVTGEYSYISPEGYVLLTILFDCLYFISIIEMRNFCRKFLRVNRKNQGTFITFTDFHFQQNH